MFSHLPDEMIYMIISMIDESPISIYRMKDVSPLFRSIIMDLKPTPITKGVSTPYKIDEEVNDLCKKHTPTKTFDWLYKHNIFVSLRNINTLVLHDRSDIIKHCFRYREFLDIMFNRFYLGSGGCGGKGDDIFSLTKTNNPIIMATIHNKVSVIRLLLDSGSVGNPYVKMIPSILDVCIKYCHKDILSYLLIHRYNEIKDDFQRKVYSIINRFDNCEDIFFYLLQTDKLIISTKLLQSMIIKNYVALFKVCYQRSITNNQVNEFKNYIRYSIQNNNECIFHYLMKREHYVTKSVSDIIISTIHRKKDFNGNGFLNMLIDHHIHLLGKNASLPFIYVCLLNQVSTFRINMLVKKGFRYGFPEIRVAVDREDIDLLKILVNGLQI